MIKFIIIGVIITLYLVLLGSRFIEKAIITMNRKKIVIILLSIMIMATVLFTGTILYYLNNNLPLAKTGTMSVGLSLFISIMRAIISFLGPLSISAFILVIMTLVKTKKSKLSI